jgi:thioredoxin-dependent peroxiredoxin
MGLQLGDIAPDFSADSTHGLIRFHEYLGNNWGIFFSHPKDFTPVCTTELGEVAKLHNEFDKRHVKVLALSVDSVADHKTWIKDINETQGVEVGYPILADTHREIANLYEMIHPNALDTMTVRCVFIIAPDKTIRLRITYPAATGRDFNEILRVIDSLQLTENYQVATPVNWQPGDDCIVAPSLSNEQAKAMFPNGFEEVKPYLRTTPQPNLS